MLIEKINILKKAKEDLDKEIFFIEKKSEEIVEQIESLENKIKRLKKLKKSKKIQLFSNINKQIKETELNIKTLIEEIDENEKNAQPFKNSKLNIFENIINLQVSLINKITNEKNEEIFDKLNFISENEISKQFDEKNPFSSKKELISRVNSQYSDLGFEKDIEKNQSCFSLPNEDKAEEKLSSSLRSINSLWKKRF